MKNDLISGYIDNELSLDEKIYFVEIVHEKASFKNSAIDLLNQENLIRGDVTYRVPSVNLKKKRWFAFTPWRPVGIFAAGLVTALLLIFLLAPERDKVMLTPYRFVLYQPDVSRVEISGSFLGWKAVPMKKNGTSGYWEVVLQVPAGEHRLCYILEGNRRIADPTIPIREKDDFGGENSILAVNMNT
ncbi:MAG: glycogen-binding domain-containing protein [Desulfobacterales bacterium]|nr:glycogen-binding domain-containing protein [Desulfobacterales bacterium]